MSGYVEDDDRTSGQKEADAKARLQGRWDAEKRELCKQLRSEGREAEADKARRDSVYYCLAAGEAGKEDPPSSVVRPLLAGEVSPGVVNHTTRFDNAIREAVSAAKNAGIPQGFIVALLHAHAARETSQLLE